MECNAMHVSCFYFMQPQTGNFVANITEAVGHEVIRVNWLGDWGTQFGLLAAGLENHDLDDILNNNGDNGDPMRKLYDVYVDANAKAEADENYAAEAKQAFANLEAGDSRLRGQWERIREVTVSILQEVYARLNIRFDHYHGEAMYGTSTVSWLKIVRWSYLSAF